MDHNNLLTAALAYAARGWRVFPCHSIVDGACSCGKSDCGSPGKHPRTLRGVKAATTDEQAIRRWWLNWPLANVAIATGSISGIFVIDLDGAEGVESLGSMMPEEIITNEVETPGGGRHLYFAYPADCKIGNRAKINGLSIDVRGDGGYVLAPPSNHLKGEYKVEEATNPIAAPQWILDFVIARKPATQPLAARMPDNSDIGKRVYSYLETCEPAIEGQNGSGTAISVCKKVILGFDLRDENQIFRLFQDWNARCEPPWSEKELRHKITDALKFDGERGNLLTETGVDLSWIEHMTFSGNPPKNGKREKTPAPQVDSDLFRCPGFIGDLMDYTLSTAPYPNKTLAFTAALAFQSYLCGRNIRDASGLRANLYLLALAPTGSGKDHPRKVNLELAIASGCSVGVCDTFASGEGIEDALFMQPTLLFQYDEFDSLFRSIADVNSDHRFAKITQTLLAIFTTADSVLRLRLKARTARSSSTPDIINHPFVTLYGTAIPSNYYNSIGDLLLSNGFFSRTLTVESCEPRIRSRAKAIELPSNLVDTASWWAAYNPGGGNLAANNPVAAIVPYTESASATMESFADRINDLHNKAAKRGDDISTAVYTRTHEQAMRLSMLHACSARYASPVIDDSSAQWGCGLAEQIGSAMILAASGRTESKFHGQTKKVLKKIQDAGGSIDRRSLMKSVKWSLKELSVVIDSLKESGEITIEKIDRKGLPRVIYHLCDDE